MSESAVAVENRCKEFLRTGDLDRCASIVSEALQNREDSPFHVVLGLQFNTPTLLLATFFDHFFSSERRKFEIAAAYTERMALTLIRIVGSALRLRINVTEATRTTTGSPIGMESRNLTSRLREWSRCKLCSRQSWGITYLRTFPHSQACWLSCVSSS